MTSSELVVLGRLHDPYGLRGWLRLQTFGDDPERWAEMPVWWVGREGEPWRELKLKGLKFHGDGLVVHFDGLVDRTAAEALKGFLVGVPREALPATDEGEYYWEDLMGLAVVNTANESLGTVVGLLETGANDVLRVLAEDQTERLLPFVASVVLSVDKVTGVIQVEWGLDW